jgi:hypothetical protein
MKRYTGDEIHGFMFPDYRSDEPRWMDGREVDKTMAMAAEATKALSDESAAKNVLIDELRAAVRAGNAWDKMRDARWGNLEKLKEALLDADCAKHPPTGEKYMSVRWCLMRGLCNCHIEGALK